ncbi:carbohydrate esterase family 4 protein [Pisolithus orientalis]|uniref:carbohydrate esterase family 4 protein n=1 Tax=Pisolithus orientalis TaxID=936130 RepID=UPI002225B3DB|nr:carbohydrate esterase family 4 protein [Pisolithus orientalis]KAI6002283.1 carbohydrate esterase family 4 protein [Pisolithus orientalis]
MHFLSLFASSSALSILIGALAFLPQTVAQDRTTEEGEAQISDPNVECTPYTYPPVAQAQNQFPPTWTVATILPNDSAAQNRYNSIQSQVPNISPKGTQPQSLSGDFGGFSYPSNDPDCWWTFSHCVTPKMAGIPDDIVTVPEPGTLGYGFDDGPYCGHNGFYDFLQSQNQTATMFYIGSNIMNVPLEAQRGLADGHEICVHTWSHRYMTALTNEEAFAELYYTMQLMELVIGVTPTCWRPPYGDVDDRIRAIADAMGLRTIIWQYDSSDWLGNATVTDGNYQALVDAAASGTFDDVGTIFLTHELSNFTMSEAIKWYSNLTSVFKHLVPVGVALNITKPYVEDGYTLPTFAQYVNGTHVGSITGSANGTAGDSANTTVSTASHTATATSSTPTAGTNAAQVVPVKSVGWLVLTVALVGSMLCA